MKLLILLLLSVLAGTGTGDGLSVSTTCNYKSCQGPCLNEVPYVWDCYFSASLDGRVWTDFPMMQYTGCEGGFLIPAQIGHNTGKKPMYVPVNILRSCTSDEKICIERVRGAKCIQGKWPITVFIRGGGLGTTFTIYEGLNKRYKEVIHAGIFGPTWYDVDQYFGGGGFDMGPSCSPNYRGDGKRNGPPNACCNDSDDCCGSCNSGICSVHAAGDCGIKPSCSPNYRGSGRRDGPPNACCNDSNDCCGNCNFGMCSVHAAGDCGRCDPKYYGTGKLLGTEGVCCRNAMDCRGSCFNDKCTKDNNCDKLQWGKGEGKGGADDCCRDSEDCYQSCKNGVCTPRYSCDRKLGKEDGVLGDCCQTGNDCAISCDTAAGKCRNSSLKCPSMNGNAGSCCRLSSDCKSGKCPLGVCVGGTATTVTIGPIPTNNGCIPGWCGKGLGKGPTGACCSVEGDCDDTCNGDGKCGTSDGTWKGPLACPNPTKTTTTMAFTTKTTISIPTTTTGGKTCKGGYYNKNLKNGPDGSCCATINDCLGACTFVPGDSYMCTGGSVTTTTNIIPTTTTFTVPTPTPVLDCISGHENDTAKFLDSRYCCTNDDSCLGICVGGICGYASHDGCTTGYEEYDDFSSPSGYCCVDIISSCVGNCVNGICADIVGTCQFLQPKPTCTPGFNGTSNYNLPLGFCCNDTNDCLGTCNNGTCSDVDMGGTCYVPTTTTTTTTGTATQTGKPERTTMWATELPVAGGCPTCLNIVVGGISVITITVSIFAIIFGWLFHHSKDEETTSGTISFTFPVFTTTNVVPITTFFPSITFTDVPTSSTAYTIITGPTNTSTVTTTVNPTSVSTNGTTISPTSGVATPTNGTTVVIPTDGTMISPTTTIGITNGTAIMPPTSGVVTSTNGTTTDGMTTSTNVMTTMSTDETTITSVVTTSSSTIPVTTTKPITTTSSIVVPVTTSSMTTTTSSVVTTTTSVPTGKTCKSGYYNKKLKNGPDGSCCSTSGDCIGDCVHVPGDSYMCKNSGVTTTSVTIVPTTTGVTTVPSTSSVPKPTPTCIMGHCGKGLGKGPTGACCTDHWDCDDTCNGDGKCGLSDGTWKKKLACP